MWSSVSGSNESQSSHRLPIFLISKEVIRVVTTLQDSCNFGIFIANFHHEQFEICSQLIAHSRPGMGKVHIMISMFLSHDTLWLGILYTSKNCMVQLEDCSVKLKDHQPISANNIKYLSQWTYHAPKYNRFSFILEMNHSTLCYTPNRIMIVRLRSFQGHNIHFHLINDSSDIGIPI